MTELMNSLVGHAPRISINHIGSGEAVFFLHGVGGNKTNWSQNLPAFAQHFTAIAWDCRGYGDSDDYDEDLDFKDFSDDLLRVLDALDIRKVHLVGLSMGSWIAMNFAVSYPERLRSLTLCCTHAGFSYLSDFAKAEFVRSRKEPLLNGMEPRDIAGAVARSLVSPNAPTHVVTQLEQSMAALRKTSYLKSIEALIHTDFRNDLPYIRTPCLVVSGSNDSLTTADMGREVSTLVPNAQFALIEDAGHLPNIEKPAQFERIVLDFLLAQRAKPVPHGPDLNSRVANQPTPCQG